MTTNFFQPPLHAALSGFALNNGVIELKFDDSNKLVGWAVGNSSDNPHSIQHSYLQYVEKKGDILERGINVCDGTNVYTFVPDNGRNTLTPKVGPLIWIMILSFKSEARRRWAFSIEKKHVTVFQDHGCSYTRYATNTVAEKSFEHTNSAYPFWFNCTSLIANFSSAGYSHHPSGQRTTGLGSRTADQLCELQSF